MSPRPPAPTVLLVLSPIEARTLLKCLEMVAPPGLVMAWHTEERDNHLRKADTRRLAQVRERLEYQLKGFSHRGRNRGGGRT